MTDTLIINPENNLPIQTPEKKFVPKGTFPPITGFWRRFWAYFIDILLLSVVANVVGLAFSSFFFKIGPYGSPLGLIFILPYFGIMNSKICDGQTLGKKWLKIAVRDANNHPISLGRSLARITLLAGPLFLSGIIGLFSTSKYISCLVNTLIYGWGAAMLYMMIFNKIPRQGLHDLILKTYVVDIKKKKLLTFPVTSRKHWVISIACVIIVYLGFLIPVIIPQNNPQPADLQSINKTLAADPRFFSANASSVNYSGSNGTARVLQITVWYKGKINQTNFLKVSDDIVKVAFASVNDLDAYDDIQVIATSEFSFGFAYFDQKVNVSRSIADWHKIIDGNSSSG